VITASSYLTRDRLAALAVFWRESFPLQPMNDALLRERVFDPPDYAEENALARFEGDRLIAISLIVPPRGADPKAGERVGGLRWFGVHPEFRRRGIGSELLEESCARLKAMGATLADFISTPPYYIQPGVDTRLTDVVAWLLRRGFEHYRTNFNMTLDLEKFEPPAEERVFGRDAAGYFVRRARDQDRAAFSEYCLSEWTANWRDEAAQGLHHDPISLFLAVKSEGANEEIVGFASYETNQCLGCFGPTGVTEKHQGHGLGKKLLYATLVDMKRLGRKRCEIGWVGPVDFYHRAIGAVLGPVFWGMRKKL
jgi:GNAT superfamily N-acetyltransferase